MKKIARVVCFSILSIVVLCMVYKVLSWKDTMGKIGSSVNQLAHTPKDTMDAVFVGSSHVYHGILPATLWSEFGIAGFDMSISAMDRDSAYYNLKHLCETQSPKVVFVDIYPLCYEKHSVQSNVYRNMLSLPYSKNAIDLVNAYVEEEERLDYILKFPIIHERYRELTRDDFYDREFAVYGRGERVGMDGGGNPDFLIANTYTGVGELKEKDIKWLDDMMALSQKEGFEIIFWVTPFATSEESQAIFNAVGEYVTDMGYAYLDGGRYTAQMDLNPAADYGDPEHMNTNGAEKVTRWIGNYLVSQYTFESHAGDNRYDMWDKDVYYVDNFRFMHGLEYGVFESNEEKLEFLVSMPNVTYVVSLDGEWKGSTLPMEHYLELLGIPSEEIGNGGVWVGGLGNNTKLADNEFTDTIYYDLDRYMTIRIKRTESQDLGNIYLNNTKCQYAKNGLNISLYNHITREIVGVLVAY